MYLTHRHGGNFISRLTLRIMCFDSKPGCGTPALFTTNAKGQFSYDDEYCRDFKTLGIKLTADSEGGSGVVKYKFTYKSIVSTKSTVIKG